MIPGTFPKNEENKSAENSFIWFCAHFWSQFVSFFFTEIESFEKKIDIL